jgi:hypothetical protein
VRYECLAECWSEGLGVWWAQGPRRSTVVFNWASSRSGADLRCFDELGEGKATCPCSENYRGQECRGGGAEEPLPSVVE